MKKYDVEAECFVHNSRGPNGTSIQFHINGLAVRENDSFNISESLSKETLRNVIYEAKTAKALLN